MAIALSSARVLQPKVVCAHPLLAAPRHGRRGENRTHGLARLHNGRLIVPGKRGTVSSATQCSCSAGNVDGLARQWLAARRQAKSLASQSEGWRGRMRLPACASRRRSPRLMECREEKRREEWCSVRHIPLSTPCTAFPCKRRACLIPAEQAQRHANARPRKRLVSSSSTCSLVVGALLAPPASPEFQLAACHDLGVSHPVPPTEPHASSEPAPPRHTHTRPTLPGPQSQTPRTPSVTPHPTPRKPFIAARPPLQIDKYPPSARPLCPRLYKLTTHTPTAPSPLHLC